MKKRIAVICLLLAFSISGAIRARESDPEAAAARPARPFRIGFLRSDEEQPMGPVWYDSLKKYLLSRENVAALLRENGFQGINALPADGYRDMLQRMDLGEFDMAFCSSVIFVEQEGDYRPILQLRGPIFDSRGQGPTLHKGVVIVGRGSPFFDEDENEGMALGKYLSESPMAFVSAHNAAGYIYPRLSLWRRFGLKEPGDVIFCGSSEEVVKYVVNGLAEAGACEAEAVDAVLAEARKLAPDREFVRVLFETPPAPTSPIVIRASLHPQQSELGRVLKSAVKYYYNSNKEVPGVTDGRDENFKNLKEEIRAFQELFEEPGTFPAGGASPKPD